MKKLMFVIMIMIFAGSLYAQEIAGITNSKAEFSWDHTSTHDFGQIERGEPKSHTFTFTNSGTAPLIISSAKGSCGCTVASFTKEPIPAGGSGEVSVTYNAAKTGTFQKTVTIVANVKESPIILSVKGEVIENL